MDESDYHKAVTEKITRFLQEIGVSIQYRELQEKTATVCSDTLSVHVFEAYNLAH